MKSSPPRSNSSTKSVKLVYVHLALKHFPQRLTITCVRHSLKTLWGTCLGEIGIEVSIMGEVMEPGIGLRQGVDVRGIFKSV